MMYIVWMQKLDDALVKRCWTGGRPSSTQGCLPDHPTLSMTYTTHAKAQQHVSSRTLHARRRVARNVPIVYCDGVLMTGFVQSEVDNGSRHPGTT